MAKLYKTPELKHLHKVLVQLRFDASIEEKIENTPIIKETNNDLDDFKK